MCRQQKHENMHNWCAIAKVVADSLKEGKCVAVTGRPGIGKSTVMGYAREMTPELTMQYVDAGYGFPRQQGPWVVEVDNHRRATIPNRYMIVDMDLLKKVWRASNELTSND